MRPSQLIWDATRIWVGEKTRSPYDYINPQGKLYRALVWKSYKTPRGWLVRTSLGSMIVPDDHEFDLVA